MNEVPTGQGAREPRCRRPERGAQNQGLWARADSEPAVTQGDAG